MVDTEVLIAKVREGDAAEKQLFASLLPVVERIARKATAKYPWISYEDLSQQMTLVIPSIIRRYDPSAAADFPKYAYHRLAFEVKDCLRENDPLGIGWPQKSKDMYPTFSRLGDESMKLWEPAYEVEEDLEEDLSDDEEVIQQLKQLRAFLNSQPQLPKPRKPARRRKYIVPPKHSFKVRVEEQLGVLQSRKQRLLKQTSQGLLF